MCQRLNTGESNNFYFGIFICIGPLSSENTYQRYVMDRNIDLFIAPLHCEIAEKLICALRISPLNS